jgi:hypothetical protein
VNIFAQLYVQTRALALFTWDTFNRHGLQIQGREATTGQSQERKAKEVGEFRSLVSAFAGVGRYPWKRLELS